MTVVREQATRERSLLAGHIHEIDGGDVAMRLGGRCFLTREIRLEQGSPAAGWDSGGKKEMEVTHATHGMRGWTIAHRC